MAKLYLLKASSSFVASMSCTCLDICTASNFCDGASYHDEFSQAGDFFESLDFQTKQRHNDSGKLKRTKQTQAVLLRINSYLPNLILSSLLDETIFRTQEFSVKAEQEALQQESSRSCVRTEAERFSSRRLYPVLHRRRLHLPCTKSEEGLRFFFIG